MLDVELFGLNPMGHHLTSILLHAANSALLYLLVVRLVRMAPGFGSADRPSHGRGGDMEQWGYRRSSCD